MEKRKRSERVTYSPPHSRPRNAQAHHNAAMVPTDNGAGTSSASSRTPVTAIKGAAVKVPDEIVSVVADADDEEEDGCNIIQAAVVILDEGDGRRPSVDRSPDGHCARAAINVSGSEDSDVDADERPEGCFSCMEF